MIKVSVVIPIYNSARYLRPLLDDLNKQDFTDAEYILVNDGSTDESLQIIQKFITEVHDRRFKVLNQNNSGVSAARNKGLSVAQGDYIIFIDSDDRINHKFISSYVNMIEKNKTDIEIFSCIKVDAHTLKMIEKVDYTSLTNLNIFDGSVYFKYVSSGKIQGYLFTYIFKKSLWNEIRFDTKLKYEEDLFAICQVIAKTNNIKIHANSASYYYYYIRDDSVVRTLKASDLNSVVEMDHKLIKLTSNSTNIQISKRVINQLIVTTYWNMLVLSARQGDMTSFQFSKKGFLKYIPRTHFDNCKTKFKRWEQYIPLRLGLDKLVIKLLRH